MRRRRERAPKTRKLLVVNCVQLVAAAAALVSAQSTIWLWEPACRLGASLCTRPPLDGDCKQRLHVCSAHDGRAGLHDELLAKTIHPCSLSLSATHLLSSPSSSSLLVHKFAKTQHRPTVTKHENFSTEMAKQAVSPLICWTFLIRPRSDHCISCPKVQSMGSTTS